MKKFAIILGSIVLLLAIAVVVVARFYDWNAFKPEIAAAVKKDTGRDLVIGGDIDLTLLPRVDFTLRDVKLSNGEGFREPQMAFVKKRAGHDCSFSVDLWKSGN